MICPNCGSDADKVIDSRNIKEGSEIRRRRQCSNCHSRFTTYEKYEATPIMIIKNNGDRQLYERIKLRKSVDIACIKRKISVLEIDKIINSIEEKMYKNNSEEIASIFLGECVMDELKTIDEVAYVRFASVYKKFKDTSEFLQELQKII